MKTKILMLSLLFANAVLPAWAGGPVGAVGLIRVSDPQRSSVPDAAQREEVAAGRRLSAPELAELREQVRQQWAPSPESSPSPGGRMIQGPANHGAASPVPRSQRP